MIAAHLALTAAALFTGAAFYINWAEQPARAVIGFLFGFLAWWQSGELLWLIGALVLVANWPFTMFVIMPVNHTLNDIAPEQAGPQSRALIEKWGGLHSVRTMLGAAATLLFLWALN